MLKICFQVLIRMLPSYHQHVCRYENSLVTKFYGVHCVKPIGGQKVCVRGGQTNLLRIKFHR